MASAMLALLLCERDGGTAGIKKAAVVFPSLPQLGQALPPRTFWFVPAPKVTKKTALQGPHLSTNHDGVVPIVRPGRVNGISTLRSMIGALGIPLDDMGRRGTGATP